jgi:RNA polymerase sigma-70 factor (ECF subfamily)
MSSAPRTSANVNERELLDAARQGDEDAYGRLVAQYRAQLHAQQATLRSVGEAGLREVVVGYVDAWERGDVDAVAAMLAEDAIIAMPPMPTWYAGREAVASFLESRSLASGRRWRLLPARASGQLAFGHYLWDGERFAAHSINVLGLRGTRITEITAFLDAEAFTRLGLPDEIRP